MDLRNLNIKKKLLEGMLSQHQVLTRMFRARTNNASPTTIVSSARRSAEGRVDAAAGRDGRPRTMGKARNTGKLLSETPAARESAAVIARGRLRSRGSINPNAETVLNQVAKINIEGLPFHVTSGHTRIQDLLETRLRQNERDNEDLKCYSNLVLTPHSQKVRLDLRPDQPPEKRLITIEADSKLGDNLSSITDVAN